MVRKVSLDSNMESVNLIGANVIVKILIKLMPVKIGGRVCVRCQCGLH